MVEAKVENFHTLPLFMKELLQAVLTEPSARNADALEAKAIMRAEFLSWT